MQVWRSEEQEGRAGDPQQVPGGEAALQGGPADLPRHLRA